MNILIVEGQTALANLWRRHLERLGAVVHLATKQEEAIDLISENDFEVIVLDLVLKHGSALAVSDFAHYRLPSARVVFVTNTSFWKFPSLFYKDCNSQAQKGNSN
mgnify:CR=1 FL=1